MKSVVNYGIQVGRMFSPISRNAFFCCSLSRYENDKISSLNISNNYKHCQSALDEEFEDITMCCLNSYVFVMAQWWNVGL